MDNIFSFLPALFLGICMSACAGFRIFLPLLVINLAHKFGIMPFQIGQEFVWMTSNSATLILAIATFIEIFAYYIPFIDNLLDTIATPVSFVAGSLIATSFLTIDDPTIKWTLGIIAGGGVAGTIAAGTSILRIGSSKLTFGLGNGFLSTIENTISLVLSIISLFLPVLMGSLVVLFVVWILKKMFFKKTKT